MTILANSSPSGWQAGGVGGTIEGSREVHCGNLDRYFELNECSR